MNERGRLLIHLPKQNVNEPIEGPSLLELHRQYWAYCERIRSFHRSCDITLPGESAVDYLERVRAGNIPKESK
jgi:hypothetical protein